MSPYVSKCGITNLDQNRLDILAMFGNFFERMAFINSIDLGIQSPKLRMVSWNLNIMRFEGDWTPLHHSLTI